MGDGGEDVAVLLHQWPNRELYWAPLQTNGNQITWISELVTEFSLYSQSQVSLTIYHPVHLLL